MGVKKRFSRNDKHYVGMFRISSPSNLFYTVDLKLNSMWSGIPNENGLFPLFFHRKGNSMIISRRLMSVVVARSMTICAEFKLLICECFTKGHLVVTAFLDHFYLMSLVFSYTGHLSSNVRRILHSPTLKEIPISFKYGSVKLSLL